MAVGRRELIAATLLGGALLAAPAGACRAPAAKNRAGYRAAIDALFAAWWARDRAGFERLFRHRDVTRPFSGRRLFDAHFAARERRLQGELLFNGSSVVAQVVTPRLADEARGICGGYASADLFLITFYPGLADAVIEKIQHVDHALLAESELNELQGRYG